MYVTQLLTHKNCLLLFKSLFLKDDLFFVLEIFYSSHFTKAIVVTIYDVQYFNYVYRDRND
jgi:hypothetical protein